MRNLVLSLLACGAAPAAPTAGELRFTQECDASAVVVVGDVVIVAVDEGTELVAYRGPDGPPFARVDLAPMLARAIGRPLEAKKGQTRELDLEGAALHGDRVWWTGSHGRSKEGKERPNRRLLFATSVPRIDGDQVTLEVLGQPRDLLPGLLTLPALGPTLQQLDAAGAAPKRSGLDIEGLAAEPVSGDLLLGLRSPLDPEGRAWVVRLRDPARLTSDADAPPRLEEHARLDLGGLGVRSMTWSAGLGAYLIAAGPPGDSGPFRLYRWDGSGAPEAMGLELGNLRPEGLAELGEHLLLISDDGGVKRAGTDCKDRQATDRADPEVWFRGRLVRLDGLAARTGP